MVIKESPNKLILKSAVYNWYDGITFFAFKTIKGNKRVAVSNGRGLDFELYVDDVDLSSYVVKTYPHLITNYLDHESLAALLHELKPDMIDKNISREDFLFSGRLWNVDGKSYMSFWNGRGALESNKELFNKILNKFNLKIENVLFEFPNNQGKYTKYNEETSTDVQYKKFMSQSHTFPPELKSFIKRSNLNIH